MTDKLSKIHPALTSNQKSRYSKKPVSKDTGSLNYIN